MPQNWRHVPVLIAACAVMLTACGRTDETQTTTGDTTAAATGGAATPTGDERFTATLDGASERPAPVNTGATGTAEITFSGTSASYSVSVTGLSSPPTGAHIHGPADAENMAGVLVPFDSVSATTTGTIVTGTFDAGRIQGGISLDSLKALLRAGMAYVNVHTADHTDGEIRGQLRR